MGDRSLKARDGDGDGRADHGQSPNSGSFLVAGSTTKASIAVTPAKTLVGAACKLRIVLDPEVGLAAGESGKEMPMLLDVLAVVERLAGGTRSASSSPANAG